MPNQPSKISDWEGKDCPCGRTAAGGHQPHCRYFPKEKQQNNSWQEEWVKSYARETIPNQINFIKNLLTQQRTEVLEEVIEKLKEGLKKHEPEATCWCYAEAIDLVKKLKNKGK